METISKLIEDQGLAITIVIVLFTGIGVWLNKLWKWFVARDAEQQDHNNKVLSFFEKQHEDHKEDRKEFVEALRRLADKL